MRRMNHETCNDILAHRLQLCGVRTWRVPAASFGSDDHGCMKLDRQHSRMMPEDRLMFSSIFALLHHRITTIYIQYIECGILMYGIRRSSLFIRSPYNTLTFGKSNFGPICPQHICPNLCPTPIASSRSFPKANAPKNPPANISPAPFVSMILSRANLGTG